MALVDDGTPQSYGDAIYSVENAPSTPVLGYSYNNEENVFSVPFNWHKPDKKKIQRSDYYIARDLFSRLLAFVYFCSFFVSLRQLTGIVGSDGVWPASVHARKLIGNIDDVGLWQVITQFPGIFAIVPISDFYLIALPLLGMVSSLLIILTGFAGCYSFGLLWLLKLSLTSLMVDLPRSNSDLLLLEAGFLAIFLFSPFVVFDKQGEKWQVPFMCRWGFRWLGYRILFCGGVSKLRGNGKWFELTAFKFFMRSIPLPNPISYCLLKLVESHDHVNTIFTGTLLFTECVLSVFIIIPMRKCRILGGHLLLVYSLFMSSVGNFGLFYLLLASIGIFCFDDNVLLGFINHRFNIFARAGDACGHYAYRFLGAKLEEDEAVRKDDEEAVQNYGYEKANEESDDGFTKTVVEAMTYQARKNWLKDVLFGDRCFGCSSLSYKTRNYIQQFVQAVLVTTIAILALFAMFGETNRCLKAFFIFVFALLLQVQCGALANDRSFMVAGSTLYILHIWLFSQMLLHGPGVWSFALWLGVLELQIGLSKSAKKLARVCQALVQSSVFLYISFYSVPLVAKEFGARDFSNYIAPFNVVNEYPGFNLVPEHRAQLVFQGTNDNVLTSHTEWLEYGFMLKPGLLDYRPSFAPFYEYILDSLVVSVPLLQLQHQQKGESASLVPLYVYELLRRLLQGSTAVGRLLEHNPFAQKPPKHVRILQYEYTYTGMEEGMCNQQGQDDEAHATCETGKWYTRRLIGQIIPPLTLEKRATPVTITRDHPNHGTATLGHHGVTNQKVLHVVHKVPPVTNGSGVPLQMADELTNQFPKTDGMLLTRVY